MELTAKEAKRKATLDRKIMGGRKVTRLELSEAFALKRKQDHGRDEAETAPCTSCGKITSLRELDGKDDGTGNFEILECSTCYGPGYCSL